MKRLNYPPAFAGGVEAIASTGGQLMPPIMGTAAFVMAELVGMNYWSIVASAFVPAVAFYVAILVSIHLAAANTISMKYLLMMNLPRKNPYRLRNLHLSSWASQGY